MDPSGLGGNSANVSGSGHKSPAAGVGHGGGGGPQPTSASDGSTIPDTSAVDAVNADRRVTVKAVNEIRTCKREFERIGVMDADGALTLREAVEDPKPVIKQLFRAITANAEIFNSPGWDGKDKYELASVIVEGLLQFMEGSCSEMKNLACEEFFNMAQKSPFVFNLASKEAPTKTLLCVIVDQMEKLAEKLSRAQMALILESIHFILSAKNNDAYLDSIITKLMEGYNRKWHEQLEMRKACPAPPLTLRDLGKLRSFLQFNLVVSKTLHRFYLYQRNAIGAQVVELYASFCRMDITSKVRGKKSSIFKEIQAIRSDSLKLLNCWIKDNNREALDKFVPQWFKAMYSLQRTDIFHLGEILNTLKLIIEHRGLKKAEVKTMMDEIFEDVIGVMTEEAGGTTWKVEALPFYRFWLAFVRNCLKSFHYYFNFEHRRFMMMIACVCKTSASIHGKIAMLGLRTLLTILAEPTIEPVKVDFYQKFHTDILVALLKLLANPLHCCYKKAGFDFYSRLLEHALRLATSHFIMSWTVFPLDSIHAACKDESIDTWKKRSFGTFFRNVVKNTIRSTVPHVPDWIISDTVNKLWRLSARNAHDAFRTVLHEFMDNHASKRDDAEYRRRQSTSVACVVAKRSSELALMALFQINTMPALSDSEAKRPRLLNMKLEPEDHEELATAGDDEVDVDEP